jgi:hypothetical protein
MDPIPTVVQSEINALEQELAHILGLPCAPKAIVSARRTRLEKLKLRVR